MQLLHRDPAAHERTVHHAMTGQCDGDMRDSQILAVREEQQIARGMFVGRIVGDCSADLCLLPRIAR